MTEEEVAFETRLAAMDRRLREIQADLVPEREPRPAVQAPRREAPPPPRPAPPPAGPGVELLGGLYGKLVSSMRELLDGYEGVLEQVARPAPRSAPSDSVSVVAGPFRSTGALKAFEDAVGGLPGVRHVEIRGYESGDRAVLEVQLDQRSP